MYSRSMFLSPHLPSLLNAMRLSSLPDVVVPQIERMAAPLSSWREVEGAYELTLTVPGLAPSDINIEIDEKVISISLDGAHQKAELRTRVPRQVDPSTLSAKLSRGMLTLRMDTLPQSQPKKIDVIEVQDEHPAQSEPDKIEDKAGDQ